MPHKLKQSLIPVFIIIFALILTACQSEVPPDPDRMELTEKNYKLFTRIKAKDLNVIYENEYPYLHEEKDFEEYAQHPWIVAYSADTMLALQIDSIKILGDTAWVSTRIEYLLSDSSLYIHAVNLWWNKYDGSWIKPSMSGLQNQMDFEEELRVYWDAVRELQEREEAQSRNEADSL